MEKWWKEHKHGNRTKAKAGQGFVAKFCIRTRPSKPEKLSEVRELSWKESLLGLGCRPPLAGLTCRPYMRIEF